MSKFKINDAIDDIVNEYRKQVGQALKRAEQKIKVRMQEIIQEDMLDDYYGGYTPKLYVRTYQLEKSVGPYTQLTDFDTGFNLSFGIDIDPPYGPSAMDHSILTLRYVRKNNSEPWEKTYDKSGSKYPVKEEEIFNNFLEGIHPNVGRANTSHIRERLKQHLDYFLSFEVETIVNSELDKIK